jgi:hypothetical protein
MDYDENLPHYFTNHHRFLWERMDKTLLNNSKYFEKQEIKWFSLSALKKDTNEFRPFYREFVDLLLREVPKIKKFIVKRKSKKSKTMKIKKGG